MSISIDISTLKTVTTSDGTIIIRDAADRVKQAIFDKWYAEKKCWEKLTDETAKATKMENLNWNTAKTSKIWEVFEQGGMLEDGIPIIYCTVCFQVYKHTAISGTSTAVTHLTRDRHIRKAKALVHGNENSELNIDHETVVKELRRTGSAGILIGKKKNSKADLPTGDFKQNVWDRYLLLGLLSALIPLNSVSNPEFRRTFTALKADVCIPSVSKLRRLLSTEYENTIKSIRNNIPQQQKVSLALDGWTSPNKIAITSVIMYYIGSNWQLKEVQLSFEEIIGEHTGIRLAQQLRTVMARYGLDNGQVLGITTDNASSNYTMLKELQRCLKTMEVEWSAAQNHIPCMAHIIQLSLSAFMGSLGVKGRNKSWEEGVRDEISEDKRTKNSKVGTTRVRTIVSMRAGFNKIIEKQRLLAVLVNGSAKRRESFLQLQRGKELIAVTLILDVKTRWNSTLAMLERAYRLKYYSHQWLKSYPEFQPLYTTDDEWHAIEYVLEVLVPFRYWTLWMSKHHTVTLHRVISIYNDMFDHMESAIGALNSKRTAWKIDIRRALKAGHTKLRKYYADVTPESGLLLILAALLDPFRKLKTFRSWDIGMGLDFEDLNSYTHQYKSAFVKYWEDNYVKPAHKKPQNEDSLAEDPFSTSSDNDATFPPNTTFYSSDSDNNDDGYSKSYPAMTPSRATRYDQMLDIARRYLSTPPIDPISIGQYRPNTDDLESVDPNEITIGFWKPDVSAYWKMQESIGGEYAPLAKMARDIFSVIPHGVGVESSFSLGRDLIGWRQSRTSGETLQKKVIVRQYARANPDDLSGGQQNPSASSFFSSDPQKVEEKNLTRLAGLADHINFKRIRKERRRAKEALNKKSADFGYISDTNEREFMGWDKFDDNGLDTFRNSHQEGAGPGPKLQGKRETKTVHSYRLKKILRVDRIPGDTDREHESSDDSDNSDDIADDYQISDSDSDEENQDKVSNEDFEDGFEENPVRPAAAVVIPGFKPPTRKLVNLEARNPNRKRKSVSPRPPRKRQSRPRE